MRRILISSLTLGLVLALAAPAGASSGFSRDEGDAPNAVPVVFDALVLRPLGLMATIGGAALYAFPVAPITLITRPGDIWKPFGPLVAAPGKYTFADPLGQH